MTLKIMCARSMTTAVNALAGKFTRASGKELDITFATVGALQAKLAEKRPLPNLRVVPPPKND